MQTRYMPWKELYTLRNAMQESATRDFRQLMLTSSDAHDNNAWYSAVR